MNDITRKRAQRVIERQVADGSMIRLGDGPIIERDRRAQQTASQAVIMTRTTGYGAHLIAIWWDRCASRYCISGAAHQSCGVETPGLRAGEETPLPPSRVTLIRNGAFGEAWLW
jgi:hypothetical protein